MSLPGPAAPATFARLDHRKLGLPTAVLWARRDMLGGREGVRQLGFLDLGTVTGEVEFPEITTLVAHMTSEHQVNLLLPMPELGGSDPVVTAEAHFEEAHPAWWSDAAHRDGRLILLASAGLFLDYSTIGRLLSTCWVAVVPFVASALDTETGTAD